jgi:translation initiation factor 5
MTTQINIRGKDSINDPNYRYKMTPLNIITEGAFKAITNIPQVAHDLERAPYMLVEFIKHKLGTNLSYKNDKLKYSNKLSNDLVQNALYEFIELFVLCETCNLPETNLVVKKDKNIIEFTCRACSANNSLQVDKLKVDKHVQKTCQSIINKGMSCVKIL